MNTNDPTPRPQAAAVPPFDPQRIDAFMQVINAPSSGDPVIDLLRSQYAIMAHFQESDFTLEGHRRRRGYLELIASQAEEVLRDGGQL